MNMGEQGSGRVSQGGDQQGGAKASWEWTASRQGRLGGARAQVECRALVLFAFGRHGMLLEHALALAALRHHRHEADELVGAALALAVRRHLRKRGGGERRRWAAEVWRQAAHAWTPAECIVTIKPHMPGIQRLAGAVPEAQACLLLGRRQQLQVGERGDERRHPLPPQRRG